MKDITSSADPVKKVVKWHCLERSHSFGGIHVLNMEVLLEASGWDIKELEAKKITFMEFDYRLPALVEDIDNIWKSLTNFWSLFQMMEKESMGSALLILALTNKAELIDELKMWSILEKTGYVMLEFRITGT